MATTPLPNGNYDLVSVLYHLLQSSETLDRYCDDAEQTNDQELTNFFKEMKQSNNLFAEKAQEILKKRLQ